MDYVQIETIRLPGLRNGEFSQFYLDFLTIVRNGDPDALAVREEYERLLDSSNRIEAVFKTPRSSAATDQLKALDLRRDNAITGYKFIVKGYTYSSDDAQREAALLLQKHVEGYGKSIADDNQQSETATLRNLIKELAEKPGLTNAINTLGLTAWIAEMKVANDLFGKAYLKRAEAAGQAQQQKTLRALRQESYPAYYALKNRLNSFIRVNKGTEPYLTVVKNCNGLVTYYNNLLAKRGNKDDRDDDAKNDDTPTDN